ncbi:MAG: ABC transporter permease [Oscillospiraceae bacterium]|jgi:ABC-2 type transport system permease protein|nr:ABC transporter permease [Oscillospiraceae bacterium]
MRAYAAFCNKEFMESVRTYKLFIMGAVFLLLGMMSPLLARFTPAILEAVAGEMPEMVIIIPEPSAYDSWLQFFSNIGQMGLLALVIVFSGLTAGEIGKGTVINMLTKGLSRGTVIFSKLSAAAAIWTVCYLLSILAAFAYTAYFWGAHETHHVFLSFFSMWLYGILLIAFVIFGGILTASIYGSMLLTGGVVVVMMLINILPGARPYNPITLSGENALLLTAQRTVSDFAPALIVCAALILLLTAGSVAVFNKKQL